MNRSPNRERRLLVVAVLASLLLHVVIGLSVAAFNGASASLPPPDDQPVQLTMVDLPAEPKPTPRINPPYMENDPARETTEQPREKTFESNANSIASAEKAASGDAPLPSQDGRETPFMDLQTQQYSIPSEGSKAQPTPPPKPAATPAPTAAPTATLPPKQTPPPTATPAPASTPEPEKLAMLTSTPPPPLRDTEEATPTPAIDTAPTPPLPSERPRPETPAAGYQREQQKTRITGRLTNRGPSSVDAVATPLGKYQKVVSDAVGARWYYYVKQKMDLVSVGSAHLEAQVDANGKIQNLRVVSNNSNESFANICLQSFQEAQIPPIPPEVAATLPDGKLSVDFNFAVYPNR